MHFKFPDFKIWNTNIGLPLKSYFWILRTHSAHFKYLSDCLLSWNLNCLKLSSIQTVGYTQTYTNAHMRSKQQLNEKTNRRRHEALINLI